MTSRSFAARLFCLLAILLIAGQCAAQPPAAKKAAAGKAENPFTKRIPAPEFPQNVPWLNISKPLKKEDLKGKFVLLDFWTYCCINCMHILPELKKLEEQFPNNLVVIGVHSAKFDAEKQSDNIRDAILRYEIVHPVINDAKHDLWYAYGVNSWPTIWLLDPEGMAVRFNSGEFKAPQVAAEIQAALPFYKENNLLDETPLKFDLEVNKEEPTPLRFPGKILADEKGNRLFISDSNHNRIVITTLDGKLIETIGSGQIGRGDGDFQSATFNHPQGCALSGDTLYIADNENHMIRKADLKAKSVKTVAGTGEQAASPFPGWIPGAPPPPGVRKFVGPPGTTELSSPWALWATKTDLFIAMAGSHQIWKMPLTETEIGPYAGNAREDIIDGPVTPREPFKGGSAFAQPSGLSSDGQTWLFVADSEGSSIREVPLKPGTHEVKTLVGSAHLTSGRLFAFGDADGPRTAAKFQHCLDVDFLDGKVYVADTYNHKIKVVDVKSGETKTLAGNGKPGSGNDPAQFHEPAGLAHAKGKLYVADTNNHLIRTIDIATGKVGTLTITGLNADGAQAVAGQ
jgi:DNA-binding beta-propeller fold protein YncE